MARAVIVEERIEIPKGVEVIIENKRVKVKGPKGSLERDFSYARRIQILKEENEVIVRTYFAKRREKALVGTITSHIDNMIKGVTKGYRYWLKIVFTHFPVSVKVQGDKVIVENFLGEKAPRIAKIHGDVKVEIKGSDIIVEGIDLEAVAQTAANIEQATKVKEFDRRVFVDGIYIYKKEVIES